MEKLRQSSNLVHTHKARYLHSVGSMRLRSGIWGCMPTTRKTKILGSMAVPTLLHRILLHGLEDAPLHAPAEFHAHRNILDPFRPGSWTWTDRGDPGTVEGVAYAIPVLAMKR